LGPRAVHFEVPPSPAIGQRHRCQADKPDACRLFSALPEHVLAVALKWAQRPCPVTQLNLACPSSDDPPFQGLPERRTGHPLPSGEWRAPTRIERMSGACSPNAGADDCTTISTVRFVQSRLLFVGRHKLSDDRVWCRRVKRHGQHRGRRSPPLLPCHGIPPALYPLPTRPPDDGERGGGLRGLMGSRECGGCLPPAPPHVLPSVDQGRRTASLLLHFLPAPAHRMLLSPFSLILARLPLP